MAALRAGKLDLESADRLFDSVWLDELAEEIFRNRVNDGSVDVFKPDKKVNWPAGGELLGHCSLCRILYLQPGNFLPGVEHVQCPRAPATVGHNGELLFSHKPSKFSLTAFLSQLRPKQPAALTFLLAAQALMPQRCQTCGVYFTEETKRTCRKHRLRAQFHSSSLNFGVYPCCYKVATRFHVARDAMAAERLQGCVVSEHQGLKSERLIEVQKWLAEELKKHKDPDTTLS